MTVKNLCVGLFMTVIGTSLYAQSYKIDLNADKTDTVIQVADSIDVTVSMKEKNDDDKYAYINLRTDNRTENTYLVLFGNGVNERSLKDKSVRFDKHANFAKDGKTDYLDVNDNILVVKPKSECKLLKQRIVSNSREEEVTIPVYKAVTQRKWYWPFKKYIVINDYDSLKLNVTVFTSYNEYLTLQKECMNLIKEIGNKTFCKNAKNHSGAETEAYYTDKIDSLIEYINQKTSTGLERDEKNRRYNELRKQLDDIQFRTNVCELCKPKAETPKRNYGTLRDIKNKMEALSNKAGNIAPAKDPASRKKRANELKNIKAEANELYKASRSAKVNKGDNAKTLRKNINSYYEDIKALK